MFKNITREEEKLIVEKAKYDKDAFGDLYELYFDKLFSYVCFLTHDKHEAEDVVSLTFEKVLINIAKFEWRGYAFSSWLYKIARNIVYDNSKKKKDVVVEDIETFWPGSYDTEMIVEDSIKADDLKAAIANLSEDQREVVLLRYIQGYSIKQTCEITGRSLDSVKSLAKRALLNIKEKFIES